MGAAGAIRRAAASVVDRACAGARGFRRALARFAPRPSAFGPAADAEAAAVRAVRNLRTFRFHYAVLQWVLLLATLAPRHRASVVFLMAASKGLLVYGGLLRAFPNSALLRRLLDRRLVAAVFVALVLADIVAAGAVANLLAALAAGVPVIVLHASFRVRDDLEGPSPDAAAENGKEDEASAVVEKKEDGDVEAGPTRRSMAAAPRSPK
ncbi:PRA1 family protein D-like [Miscanthus floridulus]|uniref:PRA1 family protein D-like n=1 Tax=Miscanthus floridulus TaxID=154761 RepID=UPI0034579048